MGIWPGSKEGNKNPVLPLQRTYCFPERCLIQVQIWRDDLKQLYQSHGIISTRQLKEKSGSRCCVRLREPVYQGCHRSGWHFKRAVNFLPKLASISWTWCFEGCFQQRGIFEHVQKNLELEKSSDNQSAPVPAALTGWKSREQGAVAG